MMLLKEVYVKKMGIKKGIAHNPIIKKIIRLD